MVARGGARSGYGSHIYFAVRLCDCIVLPIVTDARKTQDQTHWKSSNGGSDEPVTVTEEDAA